MKIFVKVLFTGFIILTSQLSAEDNAKIVHDANALMTLVNDDVKWLYIITPDSLSEKAFIEYLNPFRLSNLR